MQDLYTILLSIHAKMVEKVQTDIITRCSILKWKRKWLKSEYL